MPVSIVSAGKAPLREPALNFLYHRLPRAERERQLAQTLAAAARNELSLENLVIAVEGDRIVGAVFAVTRPGGAAFLWPPIVRNSDDSQEIAGALLEAVGRRVDQQQIAFTQCLLDPVDEWGAAALERGGVPRITDLVLLSRSLPGERPPCAPAGLTFECYTPDLHRRFVQIIESTYDGTLDCPALARIRSGEQLLEAHRSSAEFEPTACRIYRLSGCDVGVLLLAEYPDRDVWEVAYMGLVPQARGRGLGRAILAGGIELIRNGGRARMEIAVDTANSPALRLYKTLGFMEMRRYAVHLRFSHRKPPEDSVAI